ncbi:hypothetical protein FGO68_gene4351 [Halteria grandinella]|uniref:TLDc domain-containing protein n=1 Tax=Halteria grandinella TaxID=5974 RepID=A0A8J8NJ93_HALGN|nr:hypothetical protein FGO68_gene4351 [Halteria grandinella]
MNFVKLLLLSINITLAFSKNIIYIDDCADAFYHAQNQKPGHHYKCFDQKRRQIWDCKVTRVIFPLCKSNGNCQSFNCEHREENAYFYRNNVSLTEWDGIWLLQQTGLLNSSTSLLYRGSRDGWKKADFHRHCDGHGNLYIFFKFKTTKRTAAAYSTVKWGSTEGYVYDPSSFVVSLEKRFVVKADSQSRLLLNSNAGPAFMSGDTNPMIVLGSWSDPMNLYLETNCESPGYNMPYEANARCALSGISNSPEYYHQLEELEVWKLVQ